ncbi:hypothetical protein [Rugosimonospora acidiphila]|uniref:hypothetical protein n=1 Tax=Rugosimonospora acidiphila TaxID=556531 RepID=UPI0031ED4639
MGPDWEDADRRERVEQEDSGSPFDWLKAPSDPTDSGHPDWGPSSPSRAGGRRAGGRWGGGPPDGDHGDDASAGGAGGDGGDGDRGGDGRDGDRAGPRDGGSAGTPGGDRPAGPGGGPGGPGGDPGSDPGGGGGDGAEPPLPTEPHGSGRLDPCPGGGEDPASQTVWADEPARASWARARARTPAGAAAGVHQAGRAGTRAGGRRRAGQAGGGQQTGGGQAGAGQVGAGQPDRRHAGAGTVRSQPPTGPWAGRRFGRRAPRGRSAEAGLRRRRLRADILATGIYLIGAIYVLERLLPDPGTQVQANIPDQTFFQWVLAYGARVVTARVDPLFTTRLGAPVGANLIANTSVLGISVPLSPITLLFGSAVTYVVFAVLALAATATSWYYVLSRHLVRSRMAAGVGGGLAGFAPAMISHSYGHPNIVAQFLVPFIVWRTIRLRERDHALRNGILLGLLVTWQTFINEEVLLIVALGLIVFVLSYAAMRPSVVPRDALPFLRSLGVAVVVSGALLAYPLWVEFRGPQHGTGANTAGPRPYPADLLSFTSFSSSSLAGSPSVVGRLAQNISEQNAFFGWPLLVLLAIMIWLMRRSRVYLSGCVVAVVLTALSLGSEVTIGGHRTTFEGPWDLVAHLPLFRQVVPTRVAVDVAPVLAVLLALAYDRVATINARDSLGPGNLVWHGALIAVLIPLVPVPLRTSALPPVPPFITDGTWHQYADHEHSLVGIPSAALGRLEPQRWSAITNVGFAIPAGYFLAPNGAFGPTPRATTLLLDGVALNGRIPEVGPREQDNALTDLRFWRASVVVVVPGFHTDAVNETGSELFGFRPRFVDGVWIWDVRRLVALGPDAVGR